MCVAIVFWSQKLVVKSDFSSTDELRVVDLKNGFCNVKHLPYECKNAFCENLKSQKTVTCKNGATPIAFITEVAIAPKQERGR